MYLNQFSEDDIATLLSWFKETDEGFLFQFAGPLYTFPLNSEQLQATLDNNDISMLKFTDDKNITCGHCQILTLDTDKHYAYIGRIIIDPERRGEGLGKKLVTELLDYLKIKYSIKTVELKVLDYNKSAHHTYTKLGFTEIDSSEYRHENLKEVFTSIKMRKTFP